MMQAMDYEPLVKTIVESGMAAPSEICGCTADYISDLEKRYRLKFPLAYRNFLSVMGCSSDNIFYSANFVYPALEKFRPQAMRMLKQSSVSLPSTAFVFLLTDTMLLFFDTEEGEDPSVFRYREERDGPERIYDSFSLWLTDFVNSEAQLEKQNRGITT